MAAQQDRPAPEVIMGWVERVDILPEGIQLKAKMDTGATTSSLNALNKQFFEQDGQEWIAFDIVDPENEQNTIRIKREITRYVRIIRHDGNHQRRPVVRIGLCMGDIYREAEMSLIDRSELTYQVLVGRNHMAGAILVDSARTHTQRPACP
ncbi:ATP-dependent zinc protease [Ectothiorhodospira magna]|nr:RimK/LysX family protein [Ectothiorhodospira magna]